MENGRVLRWYKFSLWFKNMLILAQYRKKANVFHQIRKMIKILPNSI